MKSIPLNKFSVSVTEDGKKALMALSKGDMRKVLNILQSTSMAFDIVNEDNVYTCVGQPQSADIQNILEILLSSKDFRQAYEGIYFSRTILSYHPRRIRVC